MAPLLVDAFREHWSAAWSTFDEGMEEIGEMLETGIQMFDYQGRSCGWVHEFSNRQFPLAEVVTTGISGISHWKLGNVDWKRVRRLLISGVIGGVIAAPIAARLTQKLPLKYLMIFVDVLIIGLSIRTLVLALR